MTPFFDVKCTSAVALIFTALLRLGWSQGIFLPNERRGGGLPKKTVTISTRGVPLQTSTETPTSTISPEYLLLLQACSKVGKSFCLAPPQPSNGEWKLHPDFCKAEHKDCKVPRGTELEMGHELIYNCQTGYRTEGNNVVHCRGNKKWSDTPSCTEIRCSALNSVSRVAHCHRSNQTVNCEFPVLLETQARVSCRPGYEEDTGLLTPLGKDLTCNENGEWEPRPLRCTPVCGRTITHQQPLLVNGWAAKLGDFPWHASIYLQEVHKEKMFYCGATLIWDNLLLTVAHCVYDGRLGATRNPETLFIMTGNIFREWDSPLHDEKIVKKAKVKNIYVHYHFNELEKNPVADIALLELEEPFVLSEILSPVCLDTSGSKGPILEPGVTGRIAGFGRTEFFGTFSDVLQTIEAPYVTNSECGKAALAAGHSDYLRKDKFCAGYTNGTGPCKGDSGSGLVFQKNDRWYLMGIESFGSSICGKYLYDLFTRVSDYSNWILQVIADEDQRKSRRQSSMPIPTTTPSPEVILPLTTPSSRLRSSCLVPPQPTYGQWKGHPSICPGDEACNIPQGTELEPGSQLVYSCNDGYKPAGNTDVYCRRGGSWSSLPKCVEISCSSLNSEAVTVECRNRTGSWISCDPSVPPRTWATVSCRLGYTEYATITTQAHHVFCNGAGTWEPEPIKCLPDCGKAITQQTPHVVNGTTARTGDFPWHASIYEEKTISWSDDTKKEHICGATIIQPNLLLTAAHCVYDADSGVERDPKKLFIMTGNIFRDYDFEWHSPVSVKKGRVKNVYRHCSYYGQSGAYASDIALMELQEPFELSSLLLPACLYPNGYDEQILDHGAFGKVAGFGRTAEGPVSGILQTITVPYIPYHECKTSPQAEKNKYLISDDKFCAGYTNGSAVCDGDSGGGLVFQVGELWHVMGVVSVGLGVDLDSGEKTCDSHSYTLYTRVSRHIIWIREIIRGLNQRRPSASSLASCDTRASSKSRERRDSLHHLVQ